MGLYPPFGGQVCISGFFLDHVCDLIKKPGISPGFTTNETNQLMGHTNFKEVFIFLIY